MRPVYIVEGKRTPQVKSGADIKDVAAPYLGSYLVRHLVAEANIPFDEVDEVIFGNTGSPAKYPNVSRVLALEAGLDRKVSAYTVQRNCASGMEATSQAFDKIALGRAEVVVAGGIECMSQMPLMFGPEMVELFTKLMKAKSVADRLQVFSTFRLPHLSPVIAIEQGLTDPFCGLNMGQTAEVLARELGISREEQDEFANSSHHKVTQAKEKGYWDAEILPLIYGKRRDQILSEDVGPRPDSTIQKLAKLRPFFERKSGTVTVGNSCPITDGGSALLFCSEEALTRYNLKPKARMVDYHFHGLEPDRMGMGPLLAIDGVLKRANLNIKDMDLIEINEAFSAQVLGVLKVAPSKELCRKFRMDAPLGEIPREKLNVNGGAISLGHPVGSTGSRLLVTLLKEMERRKSKFGVASLCIGGGQGGATIIERCD